MVTLNPDQSITTLRPSEMPGVLADVFVTVRPGEAEYDKLFAYWRREQILLELTTKPGANTPRPT